MTAARKALCVAAVALAALGLARAQGKPGSCSPASALQVCAFVCRSDLECPGYFKCCPTACGGFVCSKPVTARARPAVKPGACPAEPGGPWVCSSRCAVDTDCRGALKCCRNRCGALACQRPLLSERLRRGRRGADALAWA
ncbi:WAP four-disulfide core domain protein 2-like [Bacillus rossius redtenbacheri]|uniref:WAP four-disulfide core domain protein 2-like n=1 Tax=Bacillus rossius redtenbacheri TaxID=93214 RepID=UPI002FDE3460